MILSNSAKNAMLQGFASTLNLGANSSLIIYTGADIAATLKMPNPIEASVAEGVLSFNIPEKVLVVKSGVVTAAKLNNPAGVEIASFEVGTELVLDKAEVYQGGYVSLTALTISI